LLKCRENEYRSKPLIKNYQLGDDRSTDSVQSTDMSFSMTSTSYLSRGFTNNISPSCWLNSTPSRLNHNSTIARFSLADVIISTLARSPLNHVSIAFSTSLWNSYK
jgi:hypothetical protein